MNSSGSIEKDLTTSPLNIEERATRKISEEVEKNIISELEKEKNLIEDKEIPIRFYNYNYIRDRIYQTYRQKVSLPTIINRAKRKGLYKLRQKERSSHEREVLTNYIGELIQHDSSHHMSSSYADKKWYLIASLDGYSRLLLYYRLVLLAALSCAPRGFSCLGYSLRLLCEFSLYFQIRPR